ncbi:MAG: CoA transferase [Actinobacteria bacterium]|nr:CoA transferase [Actinomycetota bacterium]
MTNNSGANSPGGSATGASIGPLAGVRVVEIASWVAAPSAGAVLADMGADVVKIEPISGDAMRGLLRPARQAGPDRIDHPFQVSNRGKRSVALDLGSDAGSEVAKKLIATANVLIVNLLPQRQERFGLDPASIAALRPGIVHATMTGYGVDGPEAWRPGYDVTAFFGRSGAYDNMREGDGAPPRAPVGQGDHAAGLAMTTAVLAALRLAEQTGETQVVDVNLFATAIWTQASEMASVLADGRQPTNRDRSQSIGALTNRFPCGDDRWVVLNMPEEHWWPRFANTVGRSEWIEDPRFATVRDRFGNMADLVVAIDEALSHRDLAAWGAIFDEEGFIWGPIQTYLEVASDPQAVATDRFPLTEHPYGAFRTVAVPLKIAGADVSPKGRAPETGEHTTELLAEVGIDAIEVEKLESNGVVAVGARPRRSIEN